MTERIDMFISLMQVFESHKALDCMTHDTLGFLMPVQLSLDEKSKVDWSRQ
jgi:hypothetical protein